MDDGYGGIIYDKMSGPHDVSVSSSSSRVGNRKQLVTSRTLPANIPTPENCMN